MSDAEPQELRGPDVAERDLAGINEAHAGNEAARDAFLAVAHTALFAASIAFVADVAPINEAVARPVLLLGWAASFIGLLALTLSYPIARRFNDEARKALYKKEPPSSKHLDRANMIALWSFPLALVCVFGFAASNVVRSMTDENKSLPTHEEKGIGAAPRPPERPQPPREQPAQKPPSEQK